MPDLSRQAVLRTVMPILAEAFAGPADPRRTLFVSTEPDSGVFGTLDRLSAAQASTPPAPGRATAAAHAEHLRYSLDYGTRWLRGDRPRADWPSSWAVQAVDDEAWVRLRERLRDEYAQLLELVDGRAEMDEALLGAIVLAIAHTSYHLGALRQMAASASAAPAEGARA
jgi:hypothetical protein